MNAMPYADKKGRVYRYGEFFPIELSPSPYNETVAQDFFSLTQDEILKKGYAWRDLDTKEYAITKSADELPDHIKDVPINILQEVIGCASCKKGFKMIQMELDFLKSMNLPLPRECPQCRIGSKFKKWIDNLRIFKRICTKCGAEFDTSYPKEEVPNLLCKKCYLEEIV